MWELRFVPCLFLKFQIWKRKDISLYIYIICIHIYYIMFWNSTLMNWLHLPCHSNPWNAELSLPFRLVCVLLVTHGCSVSRMACRSLRERSWKSYPVLKNCYVEMRTFSLDRGKEVTLGLIDSVWWGASFMNGKIVLMLFKGSNKCRSILWMRGLIPFWGVGIYSNMKMTNSSFCHIHFQKIFAASTSTLIWSACVYRYTIWTYSMTAYDEIYCMTYLEPQTTVFEWMFGDFYPFFHGKDLDSSNWRTTILIRGCP